MGALRHTLSIPLFRYTLFIPLYPLGVWAEMAVLWLALPQLEAQDLYSFHLPNKINWGFKYSTFIRVSSMFMLCDLHSCGPMCQMMQPVGQAFFVALPEG